MKKSEKEGEEGEEWWGMAESNPAYIISATILESVREG